MTDIYDISDLEMLARDCLTRAGVGAVAAAIVARDVAMAEVQGLSASGFEALLRDIRLIRYGRLHPSAETVVTPVAPTIRRLDAGHGFAAVALANGLPALVQTAKSEGMAMLHLVRASEPGAMAAALADLAGQGLAAVAAQQGGLVHAIRPGTRQTVALGGAPQTMLSALLSQAPAPTDSPLDGPVTHSAWLVAMDPAATAASEMLAHLPATDAAVLTGGIALPPDLLVQIVNA